jgi:hypothetical protein
VFAEFAEARVDCRRYEQEGVCAWAGIRFGVVALRTNPIGEGIGRARSAGILIADFGDAYAVGLVRRELTEALIIMREHEDDDPWLRDRVSLKDVKRMHGGDAYGVSFVSEREGGCFGGKLRGWCLIARIGYWNQVGVVIGRHEGWSRSRTIA